MSDSCAPGSAAADLIAALILTFSSFALNSSSGTVPFNFNTACTSGGIGTPAALRVLLLSCCKRLLALLLLLLPDVPDD
jgi:hypothetical protein